MRGASTLPVYSFSGPKFIPGIDWSDHLNYWEAGYKAVMVSDTAIYRNANYHTAQDTADTLDYHRMAMVVQGVYQVSWQPRSDGALRGEWTDADVKKRMIRLTCNLWPS